MSRQHMVHRWCFHASQGAFLRYLQLAGREVERGGALLSPQKNGIFDGGLAKPEVQEGLPLQAARITAT